MIGVVLAQLGRLEDADRAYTRALELAPGLLAARKNRAVNAFTLGRFPEAAREFEDLARVAPKDFVPRLFLGLLALRQSKLEEARAHLAHARRLAPGNARVLLAVIKTEFLLGNRDGALEAAAALGQLPDLSDGDQFELGVVLAQFGANAEAGEAFRALRTKDPRSYDAGFNLALVEYRAGRHEQALAVADAMRASGHRTGELFNLRAWILSRSGRPNAARESLEEAAALEPDNADHILDLNTLWMNENKREAALRLLEDGMRRIPKDARLRVAAGLLLQSAGDRPEAEKRYRQALEVEPASGPAHLALANLLYESGRVEQAFAQLDRGLAILPGFPLLPFAYGALLLDSAGESDRPLLGKAKSMLLRAAELSPNYTNTWYLLGRLSQRLEDDASAQDYFEKACALDARHSRSLYQLSQIVRRRGDNKRADELAAKVRSLREEAVQEDRKLFAALAEESLRGGKDGGSQALRSSR
jgi:tetratricopeptide (TPR) repeat protein